MFGYPVNAHIKQGKLEPRALKCLFLGYLDGMKGYKLWYTNSKPPRAIISSNVVFNKVEILQSTVHLKLVVIEPEVKD